MVDWRPIMGVIPPLTEQAWLETFAQYQQYPEYLKLNQGMTLDAFKGIFYWEYLHRLLGRTVGLVFFVPFCVFWLRKKLDKPLRNKLWFAFILGGLQGLMGWYMVMSGLIDEPRVSHFRLAAHLLLAFLIISWLFWVILDLNVTEKKTPVGDKNTQVSGFYGWYFAWGILAVIVIQIVYGAFTAGTHAGIGYNTFPKMHDRWIAEAVFAGPSWWNELLNGHATIQFMHRWIGTLLLGVVIVLWWLAGRPGNTTQKRNSLSWLLGAVVIQYLLGVYTLIKIVPIAVASIHQAGACIVLLAGIYTLHCYRPGT